MADTVVWSLLYSRVGLSNYRLASTWTPRPSDGSGVIAVSDLGLGAAARKPVSHSVSARASCSALADLSSESKGQSHSICRRAGAWRQAVVGIHLTASISLSWSSFHRSLNLSVESRDADNLFQALCPVGRGVCVWGGIRGQKPSWRLPFLLDSQRRVEFCLGAGGHFPQI